MSKKVNSKAAVVVKMEVDEKIGPARVPLHTVFFLTMGQVIIWRFEIPFTPAVVDQPISQLPGKSIRKQYMSRRRCSLGRLPLYLLYAKWIYAHMISVHSLKHGQHTKLVPFCPKDPSPIQRHTKPLGIRI